MTWGGASRIVASVLGVACAAGMSARQPATAARGTFFVTDVASSLVTAGLAKPAPPDAGAFVPVASPGLRNVPNEATATSSPWIDSNAWRFERGVRRVKYASLAAGAAPLAAAEAFTFDVEAILDPAPADVEALGQMLRFLSTHVGPPLPARANVAVVDTDAPLLPEVLNMLTRRNLLYRVVKAPDPSADVTIRLGSEEFPMTAAVDPSAFAARVRATLGDERRLVRVYGSNTVLVRLLADAARARLILLNFSRSRNATTAQNVRVRVLGRFRPVTLAVFGAADEARLEDVEQGREAVEFTLPLFTTVAIVDLQAAP